MEIKLGKIKTNNAHYHFIENLLSSAFPEDERRDSDRQRWNTDCNNMFHCLLATDDNFPLGLFNYWDFSTFIYCEHFAISESMRDKGIGGKVLQKAINTLGKPLVIEVEKPTDDISKRRIKFYERQGLILWNDKKYFQPPYRANGTILEMLIMSTPDMDGDKDFEEVVRLIHQNVYGLSRPLRNL